MVLSVPLGLQGRSNHNNDCNLLLQRCILCKAWLVASSKTQNGTYPVWAHANHLYWGVSDVSNTRYAQFITPALRGNIVDCYLAIFTILQFASDIPEISSNILTVTAISLPLSSLWASASTNKPSAGARGPDAHRKFIVDTTTANSTRNMSIGKAYGASPSSKPTNEKQRLGVLSSVDSESIDTPRMQRWPLDEQVEKDMEMQDLQGKH